MAEFKGLYKKSENGTMIWDKIAQDYRLMTPEEVSAKKASLTAGKKKDKPMKPKRDPAVVTSPDKRVEGVDMEKLIAEITAKVKAGLTEDKGFTATVSNSVSLMTGVEMKSTDIPDTDLLDKPKTYYAYRASWTDLGYRTEKGQLRNPPYNAPICFKPMPKDIAVNSEGKETWTERCILKTWSKKVVEYVESHPMYGVEWFDTVQGLSGIDKQAANYRLQASVLVNTLNRKELLQQCSDNGIQVTSDFNGLRLALITKLANDNLRFHKNQSVEIATRNMNEALLKPDAAPARPL